jgi:two-component system, sporulation sensor kinase D
VNIYSRKQRWKILLFIAAVIIVAISLWYTNSLVRKIAQDERDKVKLWAEAIQRKASLVKYTNHLFQRIELEERKRIELWALANKELVKDLNDFTFVFEVIRNNTTIPVIITDEKGHVSLYKNLDSLRSKDTAYLRQMIDSMRMQHAPLEIDYYKGKKNYLYYSDSRLFSQLRTVFGGLIQSFITEVAVNSASVPVIYTDSTKRNVIAYGKLDSVKMQDPVFVDKTIASMAGHNTPIEIDIGGSSRNYIFYEESFLLTQLKYYPYVQFGVIGLFLLISYLLFSTSRRAEQNQVWVGMAKETAHQLGTPLSSLMAWIEVLRMKGVDEQTLLEMRQDLGRLETITERFSKIGSMPVLEKQDVVAVLSKSVDYIRTRTSRNVRFDVLGPNYTVTAGLNVPLFEWVIENICKNAVDAMDGQGSITIEVSDLAQFVYIDIKDTGKGIPKSKFKTVFEPGYTTKERGWGLGLSLVKRIIENYHAGKIFVKGSEPGKGTTFRIVLNK